MTEEEEMCSSVHYVQSLCSVRAAGLGVMSHHHFPAGIIITSQPARLDISDQSELDFVFLDILQIFPCFWSVDPVSTLSVTSPAPML